MVAVSLEGVRKKFGDVEVIRGIDLDIAEGELVVLVGPSGCGKSTILRLIAGLEEITEGIIRIDDEVVNDLGPKDRNVAMVFQSYALYPHMTVFQNMGFGLRVRKRPKEEIERKVKEASEILDLGDFLGRYPRQLSGGQRQRVAMGRSIVRDPKVFLFDEPLSNLDAKLRVQMRTELRRLHERLGNTAIYVTHDQIEALTMGDRVVVLRNGRIEQVGKALEVYDRPANTFVAQFIGSPAMNLIEGIVHRDDDGACELVADGLRLPLPSETEISDGHQVICGVRPEHFTVGHGAGGIPCTITHTEPIGREILIHATIGKFKVCIASGGRPDVRVGDRTSLGIAPTNVYIFDRETERCL
ncbi:MAG: sn-glycerol-3-phosphate ABC transporter ATP-binding protein UgpC [Nitrospiraceae bacterium]|nr:sn-glycerol-3-phosphate ABC transporter ATP-binding protein UgpC [Nitrospiraceae bacterium]